MESNSVFIESNLREPIKITTMNDIHGGSANCAVDVVVKKVRSIAEEENTYWGGIGDYCEWITTRDPRFDPANIDDSIVDLKALGDLRTTYINWITDLFWPIRNKCLFFSEGNHEERYGNNNDGRMGWAIAKNLGLEDRFAASAGFTNIIIRDGLKHSDSFMTFHAHGYQAGRKGGALVNGLDDLMGYMEADIYLLGHSHQYLSKYKVSVYSENDKVYHRQKVGWHCGSFLKTYEQGTVSYAERKLYSPNVLWTPTVTIHPARDGHGWVE